MAKAITRSWGPAVLRLAVGLVFLMHGWQKFFVIKPAGFTGALKGLGVPLPGFFAYVVILVELLGGIALILGVATRLAAVLLIIDMLVAVFKVHLSHGFFLPMGYEFALTMLLANISLLISGAGAASIDSARTPEDEPA